MKRVCVGKKLVERFGLKAKEIGNEFDKMIYEFAKKHKLDNDEITELMTAWLDEFNAKKIGLNEGELEKILFALFNKDLAEAVSVLSDYILIANWFDKEDIECLIDEEITEKEFEEVVRRWNDYGKYDEVSELVRDFV